MIRASTQSETRRFWRTRSDLQGILYGIQLVREKFRYLNVGLSIIRVFVGLKMMVADFYTVPIGNPVSVEAGILAVSVASSLLPAAGGTTRCPASSHPLPGTPARVLIGRERR